MGLKFYLKNKSKDHEQVNQHGRIFTIYIHTLDRGLIFNYKKKSYKSI